MKKLLIGCGAILFLVVILAGVGIFWVVQRGRQMVGDIRASQIELETLAKDFPFAPRAEDVVAEARLVTWLDAAEKLVTANKDRMTRLQTPGQRAGFGEALNLIPDQLKELTGALREAKMSAAEFTWIKDQLEAALRSDVARAKPELMEMVVRIDVATTSGSSATTPMGQRTMPHKVVPITAAQATQVLDLLKKHDAQFKKIESDLYTNPMVQVMMQQGSNRMGAGNRGQ